MAGPDKIIVHALWAENALHLWGEPADASLHPGDTCASSPRNACVDHDKLRTLLGDIDDALLASGGEAGTLTLLVPEAPGPAADTGGHPRGLTDVGIAERPPLCRRRVATLAFSPADAVDLLTGLSQRDARRFARADSLRYWTKLADFVFGLLAAQHFVPAAHQPVENEFLGHWRAVVDGERHTARLQALVTAMPPVCRAVELSENYPPADSSANQAANIVESFLRATLDAVVRRCLEGDDMAHALLGRRPEEDSPLRRWLRALVGPEPQIQGDPDACRRVYQIVRDWLSKLDQLPDYRAYRTCFQLTAPAGGDKAGQVTSDRAWRLTLHVQDADRPDWSVAASQLTDPAAGAEPRILRRPFDHGIEKLRADVARAARHFLLLTPCASAGGPVEIDLTLEEAYNFLRDAAPVLELEGFGVWLPTWWRDDRPRMRLWLDVRPTEDAPPSVADMGLGLETVVGFNWRAAVGDETLSIEELRRLATTRQPLARMHGTWSEVQPEEIQSALRFLQRRRAGRMTVFEALRLCYTADDLETGLPVAGIRASGWIDRLLSASQATQSMESLAPPVSFRGTLRPYQIRGMEWLMFLSRLGLGACLADDMGLGKTIQLIALLLKERERGGAPGPTLLVVPMSLVGNWQRELERFGPDLDVMVHHGTERLTGRQFVAEVARHDVVISTYGLIPRDLEHLGAVGWYRVVLDEAQNIKNPAAKQAQAIRSLRAVHRVALTGTPVENRLSELWSIMDFLNVGYLASAAEFRRRFAVPIERHHDSDRAGRLRDIIRPFLLRRLKNDPNVEVDLPERMEMKVYCNLTREQAGLYQAVVDDMLGQIDSVEGIRRRGMILVALVKLKQVCNHPAQFLGDASAIADRSGKCDRLADMLEEVVAEGDSALIFTQFRRMAEMLHQHLRERFQREVLLLHGGTPRGQRDEIVGRFQDPSVRTPLLVLSLKAGGYGLNLTAANHVFHFDRWWNPAVEQQATDRAHRIGQERRVQVHKFICIGTLEERIDALLETKRDLADRIVGSGEKWLTELSTEKLREVLELSRDAVAEP